MNCNRGSGNGAGGNGTIPAYSERIKLAKHAGMAGYGDVPQKYPIKDIMTKEAYEC